ncbi:hypothetical protein BDA96_06G221700 [Sorghum bicolor]|uniref:Uncharacterized protein n=2 Tax=Sorghum bicolor TaxID=4558 RepID=A0A921QTC7_SORBI|nr:hypothetical protein BDA96_06G221700 [Sorghum bicolor]KXG27040.1 hypothetical protein SORBI_3006G202800 [Sorghum bicolor]
MEEFCFDPLFDTMMAWRRILWSLGEGGWPRAKSSVEEVGCAWIEASSGGGGLRPCSCVWHGGAGGSDVRHGEARSSSERAHRLARGFFFCFLLINQCGHSKNPASINRLIEVGKITATIML